MTEKKRKISILGTGNVGASVAYAAMIEGLASEILLVDINKEKAKGLPAKCGAASMRTLPDRISLW